MAEKAAAALLGIDFIDDDDDGDAAALGMSSSEYRTLMESSVGVDITDGDEEDLMRSLSELGIDGNIAALPVRTAEAPSDCAPSDCAPSSVDCAATRTVPKPSIGVAPSSAAVAPLPVVARAKDEEAAKVQPAITITADTLFDAPLPPPTTPPPPRVGSRPVVNRLPAAPAAAAAAPRAPVAHAGAQPPRPPPVRYAADYQRKQKEEQQQQQAARRPPPAGSEGEDLMNDLFAAFDLGKQAVKEVFAEVRQSFKDANSDEVTVTFAPGDSRLGMRVERRPLDDACEVTYVEPGGAAEARGVELDDVVIGIDGRQAQSYDGTLRMLTKGARPMRLHLLRPQHLFNSPLHFKLEDEVGKAARILRAVTSAPETEEAEGQEVMREIMRRAVAFVFMTTVKVGGFVSGMGGTGILVSRLPGGGWSAPVAVGSFGLGWGLQVGAALADVVVVFMRRDALRSLTHGDGTELSLGPESGVAVGPVGRVAGVTQGLSGLGLDLGDANAGPFASGASSAVSQLPTLDELAEDLRRGALSDASRSKGQGVSDELLARAAASASAFKPAYTYSHSKGLFVGVSLEGSALSVRSDVNRNFYGRPVTPLEVLEGGVERPMHLRAAGDLYAMLTLLASDDPLPPERAPERPQPREQRAAAGGAGGGGQGAWVPPRDKWASTPPASAPSSSSWVPPRDRWANDAPSSRVQQASARPPANPFTEPGDIPSGSVAPLPRGNVQPPIQPPAPTDSFSISGAEGDEDVEEFSI